MPIVHLFLLQLSQQSRYGDRIANLPSIHVDVRQLAHVAANILEVDVNRLCILIIHALEVAQQGRPDLLSLRSAYSLAMHRDLDARFEKFVKRDDTLARQDENAFVVFENTEEDSNESVPFEVGKRVLLKKRIDLVEEHDAAPDLAEMHHRLEVSFDLCGLGSTVTARTR
jgi:hypothetical protein